MMSEHHATVAKIVTVELSWSDVFAAAAALLLQTPDADVRWKHVERAQRLYAALNGKFVATQPPCTCGNGFDPECQHHNPPEAAP